MKICRIWTGLILTAMIALLCCGIAGAEGTDDLPNVTVNTWPQIKNALDTHPDGVFITLGRTIVAGKDDTAFSIKNGQNIILDLNGKTLNRNTIHTSNGSANRTFNVQSGARLTIRDSAGGGKITGGHSYGGGCISVKGNAYLTLEGGTLTQNEADAYGGAVFVNPNGTFRMTGGAISGNQCWASEDTSGGGGIINEGLFIMEGGSIDNNISYYYGGGILNYGTIRMTGGTITGNQCRYQNGGGIMCTADGEDVPQLFISGGSITDNTSGFNGGGIYSEGPVTIRNCTISGNTALKSGGGINLSAQYVDPDADAEVIIGQGTVVAENTAMGQYGGGLDMWTSATFEDGVVIRDNYCAGSGGGIALFGYEFHVHNITVTGNSSGEAGNGIRVYRYAKVWMEGDTPVINNNECDNMYLNSGAMLRIATAFSEDAWIGVDPVLGKVFTIDYSVHNTTDPSQHFHFCPRVPESETVSVVLIDGEVACAKPEKYSIALQISGEHGTASVPANAYEGEIVTVSCSADEGYGVSTIAIIGADDIEEGDDGTFSFVMPASAVEIRLYFDMLYSVNIFDGIAGSVSADRTRACANQPVRLNVDGEMQGILTYTNAYGQVITIVPDEDGEYSFKMPRADTTVSAAYTVSFSQPENGTLSCSKDVWNMTTESPVIQVPGADFTISAMPSSTRYNTEVFFAYTENGVEHVEIVTMNPDNSFSHTFTMPSADVTVTAVIGEHIASSWSELQSALSNGWDVYLAGSIAAEAGDGALTVPAGASPTVHLCGFTIDRNLDEAQDNGSVFVNHGTLTLIGPGVITGGNTTGYGGGVLSDGNALKLYGPTVTGNRAGSGGGVYPADGALYLSGAVCVTGNTSTASDHMDNVYLPAYFEIDIAGEMSGAHVGIGMAYPRAFTVGLYGFGDASVFTSDSDRYTVAIKSSEAMLSRLYSITVNDRFIKADKALAAEGEIVTLNVNAPQGFSLIRKIATNVENHEIIPLNGNSFTMFACDLIITAQWQKPAFGEPDLTLPDNTEIIENFAFEGAAMTAVWIPDRCTYIGALSFCDCPNLERVRIPAGCEIGTGAFDGCEEVYIYSTVGSPAEAYCQDHANCVFVEETQP